MTVDERAAVLALAIALAFAGAMLGLVWWLNSDCVRWEETGATQCVWTGRPGVGAMTCYPVRECVEHEGSVR